MIFVQQQGQKNSKYQKEEVEGKNIDGGKKCC